MKKYNPNAKLIWIDSNDDNQSNSPLTYLHGRTNLVGQKDLECIEREDIAFVGVSNTDLSLKNELVIG